MTDAARNLVLALLQQAVAARPKPWQVEEFARVQGIPPEHVSACLELLRSEGVLKPVLLGGRADEIVLTPGGAELAQDPRSLDYFCAEFDFALPGETLRGNPLQRKAIADLLRDPPRPRFNRLVLWANLIVFGIGLFMAYQKQAVSDFLMPIKIARQGGAAQLLMVQNDDLEKILHRTGLLTRLDILRGEWWRLLSCCFVQIGVIHLAMNMFALRIIGSNIERMWGSGRYLVLYALAGVGGSCAALTTAPALAGASGALCGLIGAEAVWLFLNRRYLPRRMVRAQFWNLLFTGMLIGLISMASVVSGAGHLGGAVVGAVAAVLLHYQRFGGTVLRVLAIVGLLGILPACLLGLKEASTRDPEWQQLVARQQGQALAITSAELWKIDREVMQFEEDQLQPLLDQHPGRRDARAVKMALDELPGHIDHLRGAAERLDAMGELRDKGAEQLRQTALDYFSQKAALFEKVQEYLKEEQTWKKPQEDEARQVQRARSAWRKAAGGR